MPSGVFSAKLWGREEQTSGAISEWNFFQVKILTPGKAKPWEWPHPIGDTAGSKQIPQAQCVRKSRANRSQCRTRAALTFAAPLVQALVCMRQFMLLKGSSQFTNRSESKQP